MALVGGARSDAGAVSTMAANGDMAAWGHGGKDLPIGVAFLGQAEDDIAAQELATQG